MAREENWAQLPKERSQRSNSDGHDDKYRWAIKRGTRNKKSQKESCKKKPEKKKKNRMSNLVQRSGVAERRDQASCVPRFRLLWMVETDCRGPNITLGNVGSQGKAKRLERGG